MNIMFLNSIDANVYGVMEYWIRLVATGLTKRGHASAVAGRKGSEFLKRVAVTSKKIAILPLDISGDFNPFTIREIKKYIESKAIEVVVVNFNKDLRLGGLAARWSGGVKVVWSLGVNITKDNLVHRILSPNMYDSVLVPSNFLKNQVVSSGYVQPDEVAVIPIGLAPAAIEVDRSSVRRMLGVGESDIVAVTSGRLVEEKGHAYLIEAAPRIVEAFGNIRFLFLGDGHLRDQLKAQISSLDLEKHFVFAGMVENVPEILSACDLMIHPSVADSFGVALVEGLRAELPIVASRAGGIPEVLEDGKSGMLVIPGDADDLADGVLRLLSDNHLAETLSSEAGKRWREALSEEAMIDRLELYFQGVIGGGKRVG